MKDQVIKKSNKSLKADTVVSVVLDMSGSMSGIASATREGLNSYLDSLRDDKNNTDEVLVSLTVFDSGVEYGGGLYQHTHVPRINTIFSLVPLSSIPVITEEHYAPSGGTPLYDAIGAVIEHTDEALMGVAGKPDVLLVIITDGDDNTSSRLTDVDAKILIEQKQGCGWTPVYLGANQDSWAVARKMGISIGSTKSYAATNDGMKQDVFHDLGTRTNAHRSAKGAVYASNAVSAGTYSTDAFFAGDDNNVEQIVEGMTKGATGVQANADTEEKKEGDKA